MSFLNGPNYTLVWYSHRTLNISWCAFVFNDEQIALEVGEGKIRPALPKHEENIEDLIELIQLSWDEDPEYRPSFATITSGLKLISNRLSNSP